MDLLELVVFVYCPGGKRWGISNFFLPATKNSSESNGSSKSEQALIFV